MKLFRGRVIIERYLHDACYSYVRRDRGPDTTRRLWLCLWGWGVSFHYCRDGFRPAGESAADHIAALMGEQRPAGADFLDEWDRLSNG